MRFTMVSRSDLKFVSEYEICPENSGLNGLLEQMDQCTGDNVYKNLIDTVLARYASDHGKEGVRYIRNVTIEFFVRTHSRKNLRKYMYEKLNSMTVGGRSLFEDVVDSVTDEIQSSISNLSAFRITQCSRMLCFLSAFVQNFSLNSKYVYLLEKAFPFYLCIAEVYTSQLSNSRFCKDGREGKGVLDYDDCYTVLCLTLRQLAAALPRAQPDGLRSHAVKMVILTHEILQCHERLRFETISKCSIVLAYFSMSMPKEETEFLMYKEHPILDFMFNSSNNNCLVLKSKKLTNVFISDSMKIVLNLTIYTSINHKTLLKLYVSGKPLLEIIYLNLIELGIRTTSFPDRITPISRTLDAMAGHLNSLQNFADVFDEALKFSWGHLDHFVEHVVLSTRSFLKSVVKEANDRSERGDTRYLEKFFRDLNSMSPFSKVRLNALVSVCKVVRCDAILAYCPQVQNQLLTLATNSVDRDLAGQVYVQMMITQLQQLPEEDAIRMWLRPVLTVFKRPNVKHRGVLEEVITGAFKSRPTVFRWLFNARTAGTVSECVVILKCVHFARINGIALPIEAGADPNDYWRDLILKAKLELYMIHQDDEVRINALRVIAECQKSTEEFTEWELTYLIRYFQYNVATQIPSIRNKIVNYYKKIFTRHHVTYSTLLKRESTRNGHESASKLKEYTGFFREFLHLLVHYLSPDANFSRRSICLELLIFVHPLSDAREWENVFQEDEVRNLERLLYDGYESNKAMAVSLLRTLKPAVLGFDSEESTRRHFERCVQMACDIRPSQSVSASYMFQVILHSNHAFDRRRTDFANVTEKKTCLMLISLAEKIEEMFASCDENVAEASKSTQFYGLLFSCRNLLRNGDVREDNKVCAYILEKLASLCLRLKSHIMPVVCNTSPEGHIPDGDDCDDDLVESDRSSKAQKILIYCWKTMKEIMLLLAEIVSQAVSLADASETLLNGHLLRIGEFFMDVFVTTKHRGVFEQAHVAFTAICKSFINSKNESLNILHVKWLNEAVSLCTGKKIDGRLCATRRSAGLPFLILSILPILVETKCDYLRRTLDPLLATSIGDTDELRMHCLNVLRFLFKNSKLGDNTAIFIDRGAISALLGFKSRTWGVRNSATLLLSTLVTRIFGVPKATETDQCEKNRMTLAVFHMRYKNLFDFLLYILETECGKSDSLILHPALLILSRLYPSHNDHINEQVKKHIPFVDVCMRNPSYRTRDLAARASVSLISDRCLLKKLNENFSRIGEGDVKDTECHGLLLQICHIFYTTSFEELPISEYLTKSMHLVTQAGKRHSHLSVTLYMDIVFMILTKYRKYKNLDLLKDLVALLVRTMEEEQKSWANPTTCSTSYSWSRFQLLTFILVSKFQHVGSTYPIITRILIKALYGKNAEMKKRCLSLLIYLNQEFAEEQYREHPLITAGDVEISAQIRALVHSFDFRTKKELLTYTHPYLMSFFRVELKAQLNKDDDCFVLVFLLLRFYPCFFGSPGTERKQNVLDWFLSMAKVHNEEIVSAIISCLKTFISSLRREDMARLKYRELIRLLMDSAAPSAADYRRLAVAQFLVGAQVLFKSNILAEYDSYNVLNVVMVLLEDDEALVRNTMSAFPTKDNRVSTPTQWRVIPSKARSTLLASSASEFRTDVAICCLTSWALRRLPDVTRDVSEVYERGETNIYSENIPVTHCAGEVLHNLLWNLGDVLSYENRTIFVEEQTLLVTTVVLNSLVKVPSPMMDKHTKRSMICVFKCIAKFIEDGTIGEDFGANFRRFFNSKILKFLRNCLDVDYCSAKAFLTHLYHPLV